MTDNVELEKGSGSENEGMLNKEGVVGSALVVGAGIGGMQAALDLAEAGIKTYLMERSPAIGGIMSQLDKTFPTNDCSMCIVSPKLVDIGRHLNIEVLTAAELESISGEPGNFTVKIRKKPRYVDIDACTSCGDCVEVCPVLRPDQFNEGLSERKAIYKLYPQAIPNAFSIEKEGMAPCRDACPINQRAQGYIALVKEGRFADAYRTIKEDNPFPSICGRVCNHPCEDACSLNEGGAAPVNIMAIKHFVSDWAQAHIEQLDWEVEEKEIPVTGKKVAVVGSGPAGMTCALDLIRQGHSVTVFEALPVPGGMMRVGVPEYRMPYDLVQREIDDILAEGVDLKLNHRVGDIPGLMKDGFDAVFVGIGAHKGFKLPLPGANNPQVHVALTFLKEISLRETEYTGDIDLAGIEGKRVLILGGGNVAIDSAMGAVRLGASWVGLACLESRENMPSHDWEVRDAEEEGIDVLTSRTFMEIVESDGNVTGVRCMEVDFHGFAEGHPDFTEHPETETVIDADVIIFAIGQGPEAEFSKDQVKTLPGGFVKVDQTTMETSLPGIYAGGDVVTGTAFIVNAIAAGHTAADAIHHFLNPEKMDAEEPRPPVVKLKTSEVQFRMAADEANQAGRTEMKARTASMRKLDFDEIYSGLTEEEAILEAARCLSCGVCSECLQCVYACKAHAIDHNMLETTCELNIGAVVLIPGALPMKGDIRPEFGYGRYDNVVTSLEFERMLSASGPFTGVVQRPSDSKHPRKVAWIQCVGSRDDSCGNGYCSSVCCMYATKEAVIAQEHDKNIQSTIFYMDIRAFGKGFDTYIERAEKDHGVHYVRSMVSAVREIPVSRNLRLSYATVGEKGRPVNHEEEFDMVVLSVGLEVSTDAQQLAERLGVELNEYGYAEPPQYRPSETSRPGIFAAGAFSEPKDIPETVIEASCAASHVSVSLAAARGTLTREPSFPPERDVSEEEPRIGVFVCHCGNNIGGVVDVPGVVDYVRDLPNVVYAEQNLYTCSQDTQEKITDIVREQGLNRVVVASCTPRTHETLFQDTIRAAGLNPHLFEMTNIREQNSWVHREQPHLATQKARELVTMAVAKAKHLRPLQSATLNVNHQALVIGGGLAGITAALSIAEQGYPVFMVERTGKLGGHARHIRIGVDNSDPQKMLTNLIDRLNKNSLITVMTETEIVEVNGYVGQYHTVTRNLKGESSELEHGIVVVATGGKEIEPISFGYNEAAGVVTQHELEEDIDKLFPGNGSRKVGSVVMIQCVGSRNEEHPYCSRICCTQAIKNALEIKKRSPETQLTILYRDIRSYGFRERLYRQAREAGVLFLEFDEKQPPEVSQPEGRLRVKVISQPGGEVFNLNPELVVLSAGIEAEPDNGSLSQLLKLPLTTEGFFLEAHVKLRPVDFAADGFFLCGLAHSPRGMDETIAQARAASIQAVALLAKKELTATPIIAEVNPKLCAACGQCVEVCPYGARQLESDTKFAEVIDVLCQGCGACVVACPNKASQQRGFEILQVNAMIDAALSVL